VTKKIKPDQPEQLGSKEIINVI